MATTEAEVQAILRAAVDALEDGRAFGDSDLLTNIDAVVQLAEGDFAAQLLSALEGYRGRFSQFLSTDSDILTWIVRLYGRVMASPQTETDALLRELYDWFVTNNITVKSRGFSLATPSANGSNVGNGTLYRLTVDENGYTFENGRPDAKRAEIINDAFSGTQLHEEILELRGAYPSRDLLEREIGSGLILPITALHHRNAGTLTNAGFEQYTSSTAVSAGSPQVLTALSGWEKVSGTWPTGQTDTPAKTLAGDVLPIAIRATADFKIRQKFSTNLVQVDQSRPYLTGVWMKKNGSTTGSGILALESSATSTATQSVTKDLSTLTLNTWEFVPIALGTGSWFKNFNTDNLSLSLAVTSLGVSTADFDGVVFAPGTFFDGSWYWFIGGYTPSRRRDYWTWTDSDGGAGKVQRHVVRAFGRMLPHTANATQITASGGRTLTFANSGSADTITASSGSFVSDGYKVGMLVTIAGSSSNNMTTGKIATVTATVLTFGSDTALTNEGPVSATTTLNATSTITDP